MLTKLFLYLDERQWELLRQEVFLQGMVVMDNGDGPKLTSGAEIVDGWRVNLEGVDAIYHQINPYIVTFTVRAFSVADRGVTESWELASWAWGVCGTRCRCMSRSSITPFRSTHSVT